MSKKYVGTKANDINNARIKAEREENKRLKEISFDVREDEMFATRICNALGVEFDTMEYNLYDKLYEIKNMCEAQMVLNAVYATQDINKLPKYSKHKSYGEKRNSKDKNFDTLWHKIDQSLQYKEKALSFQRNLLFDDLVNECGAGKNRAEQIISILNYI